MKPQSRSIVVILRNIAVVLLLVLGCHLTVAGSTLAAAERCPVNTGLQLPDSAFSGAWNDGLLTFVDVLDDELVIFSADQGYRGSVELTDVPALGAFQPQAVHVAGGRLLVQFNRGRLATLNSSFHPVALRRLDSGNPVPADERLDRFYSWDVAGDDLIVCGDVWRGGNWPAGFLRAPLEDLQSYRFLPGLETSYDDEELIYCRIGYDYIATLGEDAYVMVTSLDGQATEIQRFRKETGDSPETLKARFPARPSLSEFERPEDFPRTMNLVIPNSEMPAGLYGWEGALYVLTRRPEDGATAWELHQVDPESGEVEGFARLPGNARHLTVAPGATWGVLEQGSVRGFENIESTGIRFIPGSAIRRIGQMDGQLLCAD